MTAASPAAAGILHEEHVAPAGSAALSSYQRLVYALFSVTLVLLPFVKLGAFKALGPVVQLADLCFAVVAVLWFVGLLRHEFVLPKSKVVWLGMGLYLLASAGSFFVSTEPRTSLIKLVGLVFLLTLLVVTSSLARTELGFKIVVRAWTIGGGLTGLLGTVSALLFFLGFKDRATNIFLWSYGSIPTGSYPRIAVMFLNANMLCSYLLVSLAAAFLTLPRVQHKHRKWVVAAIGCMAFAMIFTLSAGLGGFALGAGFGWLAWRKRHGFRLVLRDYAVGLASIGAALGFLLLSVFLLVPPGYGDVSVGVADLSFEGSGRVANWKGALDAIQESPLTGKGIGLNIALTSHPRAFHSMEKWGTEAMHDTLARPMEAHNVWLNIWGQIGVFGVVGFALVLVACFKGLVRRSRDNASFWDGLVLSAALVAAVFYHGLLGGFEESRQYWWLFGLALAARGRLDDVSAPIQA